MASIIQLKTGTGSAIPSSLTQGEVAINIDNGLIYYGSGSGNIRKQLESFKNITASGDISASGTIYASKIIVSEITSSFITSSTTILVQNFTSSGDANFKGNVTASGNISASGDVYGVGIYGVSNYRLHEASGTSRHIITNGSDNLTIAIGNPNFSSGVLIADAHLTASGNISASGTLTVGTITNVNTTNVIASGNISASGDTTTDVLHASTEVRTDVILPFTNVNAGIFLKGNVTSSGNISASLSSTSSFGRLEAGGATIFQTNLLAGGSTVKAQTLAATLSLSSSLATITEISSTNITASGIISASGKIFGNSLAIDTNIVAQGTSVFTTIANVNTTHITASGNISASGDIYGTDIRARGAYRLIDADGVYRHIITNGSDDLRISIGNANFTSGVDITGNITASANISSSATITAEDFVASDDITVNGTLLTAGGIKHLNNTDTEISFGTDSLRFRAGNVVALDIIPTYIKLNLPVTASANISSSGDIKGLTITTPGNISGSTIKGQTLIADVFLSAPSASITNLTNTNITSSGNISSSSTIFSRDLTISRDINASRDLTAGRNISASGDIKGLTITTPGNITGSTIEGQTLIADVFLSAPSASIINLTNTNITSSGNISASGTITANKLEAVQLVSRAGDANTGLQFGSDTVQIESNDVIIANFNQNRINLNSPVTASGDISSSGNIYSNNIEILAQGSARIATITNTTQYWGPNFQGPYHTANWNQGTTPESDGNLILERRRATTGFIVPYSASLVGFDAIVHMNSGENVFISMSLHRADALTNMDLNNTDATSPGFTASHAVTGTSQGNKGFNSHRMTGSCNVELSPFDVIFPNVKIDATGNDDSSMAVNMTYVIKIKRIK